MKHLIVCILGYRMVPNIQFIKEKRTLHTHFLFISTPELEEAGIREDIKEAFGIAQNELPPVIVDKYAAKELEEALTERNFERFTTISVNVSEGSPMMISITTEFFRDFAADIFFIPDTIDYMIQIFPKRKRGNVKIKHKIGLEEYVTSHGLEMRGGELSGIPPQYIRTFMDWYIRYDGPYFGLLSTLRKYRFRRVKQKISAFANLSALLKTIQFPLDDPQGEIITGNEICFLTGDWFEEFVYYRIKDEFGLSPDNIKTGVTLSKEGTMNEFDVMFFYEGKLYTIECKTSIKNKESNIMTDTIYKVKALQNNLGYYSDSNIFTLSSREKGDVRREHIERGRLFNIDVYCREDILGCTDLPQMLKIKKVF